MRLGVCVKGLSQRGTLAGVNYCPVASGSLL